MLYSIALQICHSKKKAEQVNSPVYFIVRRDPQSKKAIEIALKGLEKNP